MVVGSTEGEEGKDDEDEKSGISDGNKLIVDGLEVRYDGAKVGNGEVVSIVCDTTKLGHIDGTFDIMVGWVV